MATPGRKAIKLPKPRPATSERRRSRSRGLGSMANSSLPTVSTSASSSTWQTRWGAPSQSLGPSLPRTSTSIDWPTLQPGMEGSLMTILADQPPLFIKMLEELGIQTCSDLAHTWDQGGEMIATFEATHGAVTADQAFQMMMVLTLAKAQAELSTKAQVKAIVADRESVIPGVPRARVEPSPVVPLNTSKPVIDTGHTERMPNLLSAVLTDPHTKEVAKRDVKTHALFQFVLENMINLEELGLSWRSLNDPAQMQGVRETLMACCSRLGTERLGALLAAAKRWWRYATDHGISVRQPTPFQIAAFLRHVSGGGPTAGASMYQALKWYETNFGVVYHTEHFLVKPHRFHQLHHTGKQQKELEPWEFCNLVRLAQRSQGTKQILASFILQAAISCIRFEHMQRSKFVESAGSWLTFACAQGKSRKQGARPGYQWAMPELQEGVFSLEKIIKDFCQYELMPETPFAWPAVALDHEDLWQIKDTSPFVLDRPMSRSRFLEIMRGMLLEIGTPREEAVTSGYNRLRRFMPTLSNCLGLDPVDLQAIGSWTELPAGGGPTPSGKPKHASVPMGLHYAGHKVARSAQVKLFALSCFMRLWRQKSPELALNADGYIPAGSWSWQELCQSASQINFDRTKAVPPLPIPDKGPEDDHRNDIGVVEVEPGALDETDPVRAAELAAAAADNEEDSSSEVSDLSPSASDQSAVGEEITGVIPPEDALANARWFRQGAKVHLVRHDDEEGGLLPWCRENPFAQPPQEQGEGAFTMEQSRICQRCLSRMPRAIYVALADYCGWLHWPAPSSDMREKERGCHVSIVWGLWPPLLDACAGTVRNFPPMLPQYFPFH